MKVSTALENAAVKVVNKIDPPITSQAEDVGESQMGNDLMSAFFKLNPAELNEEVNRKLSEIYKWAAERGKTEIDIVNILKDVKYRLGAPSPGITHIDHIYNYTKLRSLAVSAETKAKAMEI